MAINKHFEGKRDLGLIDPRKLTVDPTYNVRDLDKPEARDGLDYLKSLIRVTGVQIPLRIREDNDKLIIVRGHRRHKVVMELIEEGHPIKLVPAVQEPRGTTAADRNWDLIDSNSEEPLKGFERAEALYRQINTFGWTEKEILRRTGKTMQWLNTQLELRVVPEAIKQQVRDGIVSVSTAAKVAKDDEIDPALKAEIIKNAADEQRRLGKKGRATPKAIKKAAGKPDKLPVPARAPRAAETEQREPASGVAPQPAPSETATASSEASAAAAIKPNGQVAGDLMEALAPFAGLANDHDLTALEDGDVLEVLVRDVRRAALVYTSMIGSEG